MEVATRIHLTLMVDRWRFYGLSAVCEPCNLFVSYISSFSLFFSLYDTAAVFLFGFQQPLHCSYL